MTAVHQAPLAQRNAVIQTVNPLELADWDKQVASLPGATFFHEAGWARVLVRTYGFRPVYLTARLEGRLRGVLPMMELESWIAGRRGAGLPFSDECPPLAPDAETAQRLFGTAVAYARSRSWRRFEVRGGRGALNAPASICYHGHAIDLTGAPEALWAGCTSAVRRAVRKAEHSGLEIEFSTGEDAVRIFHGLLCRTRRRQGLPPQPLRFFRVLQQEVLAPGNGCVVIARHGGRPVAGALFVHAGDAATYKYAASDESFQSLRPSNLVLWRGIEWHARAGFRTLDLGRTSLANEGLRRFKCGWGASERRIEYVRYDCRAGDFSVSTDATTGWHNAWFRILPLPLARLVGALAYRHIA